MFCYGVKRDHYEKLVGIRELSERLAQDCFNNPFSPDRGTPEKNIPPLDELDYGYTVSTCLALHFYRFISHYAAVNTISDMNLNMTSSISIGSQHIAKNKNLNMEGYITGILEVTFQGSFIMEIDASKEAFGFARDVIGSTINCTTVNKFVLIVLKRIIAPPFVSLDMFHV